ncbi:MAG: heavy-metal-associated domain-containing protein [Chloroflexi bacterium]|nr:heavy-metal-associated domain-containing protein [Chloroflexota bacterium]
MEQVTFKIPALYADHHVLQVRKVLGGIAGVSEVVASAGRKSVAVAYDEGRITAERIAEALRAAGYAPDGEVMLLDMPERSKDGSAWFTVIKRDTETIRKDLEMSGDFRRY